MLIYSGMFVLIKSVRQVCIIAYAKVLKYHLTVFFFYYSININAITFNLSGKVIA